MISQRKGATAGVAAAALLALSLTTGFGGTPRSTPPTEPAASGSAAGGGGDLVIGVSNTLAGNGWREEMICAVKAQALASGEVSKVIAISRNGGPTEQIQDLQNLISQGVNAIILNPSDREQLNPVIEEAISQGIVVVAVDQAVTAEGAYVATNDQVAYGRLGAQWLADSLDGKGSVLYMRGIEGVPADDDRNTGLPRGDGHVPRHHASRRSTPGGTTPRAVTRRCRSSPPPTTTASGPRASTTRSSTRSRPSARIRCR